MFFLGLLALCVASFLLGFGVGRMLVVPLVALLGISAVVADQVTRDLEDPALVATVQLLCTAVIAGCGGLGVATRRATRHRTR
jgi:L-cystine uptake protein TcyP (sodium:dicarboxylate symporter family)